MEFYHTNLYFSSLDNKNFYLNEKYLEKMRQNMPAYVSFQSPEGFCLSKKFNFFRPSVIDNVWKDNLKFK